MKKRLLTAALAACLSFAPACAPNAAQGGSSASGSLGVSHDDALLYAADGDLDQVFVVDAKTQDVVATIDVGRQPEKVLVGPDDTVFVTNRMGRSVSVIRRGETRESARIAVGVEPVGLAASADGKTLYVVNATSLADSEVGTLMAIDTSTLQVKWETAVGSEPRAITLMADGKAAISLYKTGDLVMVDVGTGKVIKSGTDVFTQLNATALGITTPSNGGLDVNGGAAPTPDGFGKTGLSTSRPRGMEAITVSPDGKQLYVASLLASDQVIAVTPGSADPSQPPTDFPGGNGYGSGSCGTTAVAAPAILTFDDNGNALVNDLQTCTGEDTTDRPPTTLLSPVPGEPIQGPKAIALEPTGKFLFIANFESNNVAIVPTATAKTTSSFSSDLPAPVTDFRGASTVGAVQELVDVGAGPTGVAVTRDGKTAFVFNSFDHSISKLSSMGGHVVNTGTRVIGRDTLSTEAAAGRRLFFSARDTRMNNPGTGISCGTCHLEGREDGHVWNFNEGPRQTPSLAGRLITQTAPFHWNGEFADMQNIMNSVVTARMGGSGVTPQMEKSLVAFVDALPAADNPHQGQTGENIARGRQAFEKAECNSCHTGAALTNDTFADVGTFVTNGAVPDNVAMLPHGGFDTPSLLGLSRTSPYLHDGSATTLKARILKNQQLDQHGKTSKLSAQEVDDMVAYLKTL